MEVSELQRRKQLDDQRRPETRSSAIASTLSRTAPVRLRNVAMDELMALIADIKTAKSGRGQRCRPRRRPAAPPARPIPARFHRGGELDGLSRGSRRSSRPAVLRGRRTPRLFARRAVRPEPLVRHPGRPGTFSTSSTSWRRRTAVRGPPPDAMDTHCRAVTGWTASPSHAAGAEKRRTRSGRMNAA